eukprot:10844314-Alexandrium_andersonii.AAC.1
MWYPVGGDIGVATVTATTATIPARTVSSSGPAGPEERANRDERGAAERSSATAADGGGTASSSRVHPSGSLRTAAPADGRSSQPSTQSSQPLHARPPSSAEGGWAQMSYVPPDAAAFSGTAAA